MKASSETLSSQPSAPHASAEPEREDYTTAEAAATAGLSEGTMRNYAWLLSLGESERRRRGLQAPPDNLPVPRRVRGHLSWPRQALLEFAKGRKK